MEQDTTTRTTSAPPLLDPHGPEVWEATPTGTPWCDCGKEHPLDQEMLQRIAAEVSLPQEEGDYLLHEEVILLAAEVWRYYEVCEFFLMGVRAAAEKAAGGVQARYPVPVGHAIVKVFTDAWNGCPEELCRGGYVPEDEVPDA